MIGDLEGYAQIAGNATTIVSTAPDIEFAGKIVRVMEFAQIGGGALVINNQASALAMIDQEDIARSFVCNEINNVLIPKGLNMMEQMIAASRLLTRPGGYDQIIKNMIIAVSLQEGKLTDNFLFEKEKVK